MIAGCIDGCARAIIYLNCADNNKAATSLNSFMKGVRDFDQVPDKVRGFK